MREIKFKFWCKGTSDNANFNKPGWWSYPDYLLQKYHDNLDIFKSPHFVACQYTGIGDDNGKEIYEGDIIEHGCTTQHYESVIAYQAPSFIAKTFYHKVDHGRSEPNWHIAWDRKGIEAFKDGWYMQNRQFAGENYLRVLGNIYENPELLG
jgi:uncharacterized phage protein (TIGR01671 family)